MIRLLLLALLFFVAYTFSSVLLRLSPRRRQGQRPPEKTSEGAPMVQDPHCGTYVPRSEAVVKNIGGRKRYFCSKECRDAYEAGR